MKKKLFREALFLLIIVAILHTIASDFYLYWSIPWIDVILHFLGGLTVSLSSIWFLFSIKSYFSSLKLTKGEIVFFSIFCVVIIGVLWEIFELYFGITFLSDGIFYIRDTSSDLLMDLAGGVVGSLYSIKLLSRSGEIL